MGCGHWRQKMSRVELPELLFILTKQRNPLCRLQAWPRNGQMRCFASILPRVPYNKMNFHCNLIRHLYSLEPIAFHCVMKGKRILSLSLIGSRMRFAFVLALVVFNIAFTGRSF